MAKKIFLLVMDFFFFFFFFFGRYQRLKASLYVVTNLRKLYSIRQSPKFFLIQGTRVLLLRTVHYIYCVAVSSKFL
jgi:hypothetical protein